MLTQTSRLLCILVLIGMLALTAVAQEQGYLQEQMEEQLEQMRESGREAFLGVLQYPQDIWKAMLELAQYPDLVVKLSFFADTADKPVAKLYEVLSSYPEEVQEAAKLMVYYPDVLDVMEDHLVVTGLVGAVYQNDKNKVLEVVSQMAEQAGHEHERAVDKWVERLDNNPESVEQLLAACKAYADKTGQPERSADETGATVSEANEVRVSGLPDANFVTYILDNSEAYPELTEEMLEHYEVYYDDAYYDHYYGYRHHYPYYYRPRRALHAIRHWRQNRPDIPEIEPLKRIKARDRFEEEFARTRRQNENLTREKFLSENANRFPGVERHAGQPLKRTKPAGTRHRAERAEARTQERANAQAIYQRRAEVTQQRARVRRERATRDQQIRRARSNHWYSWQRPTGRSRRRRSEHGRRPTRQRSHLGQRR